MRKIEFGVLTIMDFKAIGRVDIDLGNFAPGCHAVRGVNKYKPRMGSNGVSKSSLWDALCFALYGRTPRGVRGPALTPWGQKVNPVVCLYVLVDGTDYFIERRAAPHKLIVDGNAVEQAYLDDLIGLPFKVFAHTVCLAQGEPLFLDLKPADKLSLISNVLGLERWDNYATDAANSAALAEADIRKAETEAATTAGKIAAVRDEIAALAAASADFAATKANELQALNAERTAAEEKAAAAKAAAARAVKAKEQAHAAYQPAEAALIAANTMLQGAELAHAKMQHLKDHAEFLRNGSGECPTCGQRIAAKFRDKVLHDITKKLAALPALDKLRVAQAGAMHELERTETAFRAAQTAYWNAETWARTASDKLEHIRARIAGAAAQVDPHDTGRKMAAARLKSLKNIAEATADKIAEQNAERERYRGWAGGFRAIKLSIVDAIMDTLSLLTGAYAGQLGLECEARFACERESKSGTAIRGINLAVDGIENFDTWSMGEGQRLRLAASLALAAVLLGEAGADIPLRVLDEPSAHLSPEGLRELAAFLDAYGRDEGLAIFLTDQRPVVGVSSVVTVTRSAAGVTVDYRVP